MVAHGHAMSLIAATTDYLVPYSMAQISVVLSRAAMLVVLVLNVKC